MIAKTMYSAATVAFMLVTSNLFAETFYWKNDTIKTENWKLYADWNNWAIGTSANGNNDNKLIPSATDDLCYGVDHDWQTSLWMDLGGVRRELRHVLGGDSDYGYRYLHLKNGTLVFNGSFTNSAYRINVYDTGKLVLAEGSSSRFGRGTQVMKLDILSGGEAELRGKAQIVVAAITVHEGGTLELAADGFGADSTYPSSVTSRVVNAGTLNLPNGFSFGGAGTTVGKNFELVQQSGTLNLGGQVINCSSTTSLKFLMCGGTVNVADDVSFVSNDSRVKCIPLVTNGCSVAFCVNDGKTFDASNMEFGDETSVRKTGLGAFRSGKSFPTSFVVSEGVFEPSSGAKLGSSLSFAPNTTLRFVAPGVQADAILGIENVAVEVLDSFDEKSFVLFSSPDTLLVAAIFDKLVAQGITRFKNKGDSITYEKEHSATIFKWKNEGRVNMNAWREGTYTWYSFLDPSSWLIGFSGVGNTDGIIPDEDDDIFISDSYDPLFAMDMGGTHRKVRNLALNLGANTLHPGDMNYYPNQAGFRQFNIRNGALEFTGSFTNVRAEVVAKDTGRFILGPTSAVRFGLNGAPDTLIAEGGGEIDVRGLVDIHILRAEVDAGGKMVFDPSCPLTVRSVSNVSESYWKNSGVLEFSSGLRFSTSDSTKRMLIEQKDGVLSLGGPIVRDAGFTPNVDLMIRGGVIRATDNVFFSNLRTNKVAQGSAVVFDVAEGKTLDVSNMIFDEAASVVKTGAGSVKFGSSIPVALSVSSGSVVYSRPVALGDSLSLGVGTKIVLASDGISASAIEGIEAANVSAEGDFLAKSGLMFFSTNETIVAAICSKLENAGVSGLKVNGNAILREKAHDSTVFTLQSTAKQIGTTLDSFEDANEYLNFFDAASWSIGRRTTGVNPDGYVPGPADDIYINTVVSDLYRQLFAFDMGGAVRLVRNYDKSDAAELWGFNGIQIRNGTFGFSGDFASTRSVIIAQRGGRFVFGDDARVVLGYGGAQCYGIAKNGGEIVLAGDITFNAFQSRIDAGGVMTINPKGGEMKFVTTGVAPNTFIYNSGTLNIPNGLALSGSGREQCNVTLEMKDGFTLNIGGNLVHDLGTKGNFVFKMHSGTINATNTASVLGFAECSVVDEATIIVNVPKGSKLKLSEIIFGEGTTVEKFGSGRLIFGSSRPSNYIRHDPIPGFSVIVR